MSSHGYMRHGGGGGHRRRHTDQQPDRQGAAGSDPSARPRPPPQSQDFPRIQGHHRNSRSSAAAGDFGYRRTSDRSQGREYGTGQGAYGGRGGHGDFGGREQGRQPRAPSPERDYGAGQGAYGSRGGHGDSGGREQGRQPRASSPERDYGAGQGAYSGRGGHGDFGGREQKRQPRAPSARCDYGPGQGAFGGRGGHGDFGGREQRRQPHAPSPDLLRPPSPSSARSAIDAQTGGYPAIGDQSGREGSFDVRPAKLKRGGTADAEYELRKEGAGREQNKNGSDADFTAAFADTGTPESAFPAAENSGVSASSNDLMYLLPSTWSCPEGNNSGIMMSEDDDNRLTSTICGKMPYSSSRSTRPVQRVALVVTNKPIPMKDLEQMEAASLGSEVKRQTSAPTDLGGSQDSSISRRDFFTREPSYAPPPLSEGDKAVGLYPIPMFPKPSRHQRVDSPTDPNDWAVKLMGQGGLRRASTGPNQDNRHPLKDGHAFSKGKVYYFEVTVRRGNALVGLVPAESVVTPEQAQLFGSGSGGAATKPNPFPILLDQSPGESPGSIGLGCRDGRLRVSGAVVARDGQHQFGAAAEHADGWMESLPFQDGDVTIGCGWEIGERRRVFFTRNGKMVNPGRDITDINLSGRTMFPAVSMDTEGSDVVGNFGLNSARPFKWRDRKVFVPITENKESDDVEVDQKRESQEKLQSNSNKSATNTPSPHQVPNKFNESSDSKPAPGSGSTDTAVEDKDMEKAFKDSMKSGVPASSTTEILPPSKFEEAKEIARELLKAARNPKSDPRVFSNLFELCKTMQQKVVNTLGQEGVDFEKLLELNDFLLDAVREAEEASKIRASLASSTSTPNGHVVAEPSLPHSSNRMNFYIPEINELVEKKDVFSLICLLRGHHDKRLAAAFALMKFAKDRSAKELGDEIRSSGGLHSLLTLFKSNMAPPELKVVTALAVAYLLPSCDPEALLKVGLRLIDSMRYLINPNNTPPCDEISDSDMRVNAALALTHFWLYALQPKFSSNTILAKDQTSADRRRGSRSILSNPSHLGLIGWAGRRRVEQRHEMIENQELLERTVSLVVAVADSNVSHDCESYSRELKTNIAFTVATICAVKTARPIAVREGVLKVLVRWLSSGDADLVLQAANALRDLTSPDDEYMAGWIHSQIVNEGALPAIVKLSVHGQADVRLAVAEILSRLSVAPHIRAAIVDAKGLNYLVQLLQNSTESIPWDETLALAAGSALLQLAAGAMMHASGWARLEIGDAVSADRRDGVINDIIDGGAIGPLAAMAKSDRGKLRLMAVETLRVISEDVSPRRWTRHKLCEAGAAGAFGRVLHDMVELSAPGRSEIVKFIVHETQDEVSFEEALSELHHALRALANILEPMSQEDSDKLLYGHGNSPTSNPQDTLVSACIQTADSGGINSLLLMTSRPIAPYQSLQKVDVNSNLDPNEVLVESCRSMASLCPLLISRSAAEKGYAKWAMDVLVAMSSILRKKAQADDVDAAEMVHQLQLDALRGLCALAEYEPLKIRIIDDSLSQVLQFKNIRGESADIARLANAANQLCLALGFSEDEIDAQLVGNDPKLLADWFCLERSMLLQAMAREEIREYLCSVWLSPMLQVFDELGTDTVAPSKGTAKQGMLTIVEESHERKDAFPTTGSSSGDEVPEITSSSTTDEKETVLRRIFDNLGNDKDSADLRLKLLRQYGYIYETNASRQKIRSVDETPRSMPLSQQELVLPSVGSEKAKPLLDDAAEEHNSLLGISPCTVIGDMLERDWIMEHRDRAKCGSDEGRVGQHSTVLPARIQSLLDLYFPSRLIQSEVLPLAEFRPESSFDFRALSMPQRRYFSFRREGQVLSRVCEKHAAAIDSDDVHWTLGFSNSSFAGEFAEILVQALYRCPIIQAMSFSKTGEHGGNRTYDIAEDGEDDGATLLANLAGSLPPWVTCLTFDNFMTKRSLIALVKRLETMGDHVGTTGKRQGTFDGLAIRNSPRLGSESFEPFVELLGFHASSPMETTLRQPPLQSLKMLDLSGNMLGDESIASVLSVIHQDRSKCSIEKLDVSGNNIKKGVFVTQVLRTYVQRHRQSQLSGLNIPGDGWCSPLTWLNLSSNNLGVGESALEIVALLKNNVLALRSLDLSNNGLRSDNENFLRVLSHSLATNTRLVELNLKMNHFSASFLRTVLHDIRHGDRVATKLAFLHADCDDSSRSGAHQDGLNQFLAVGRADRLKQYLQGKRDGVGNDDIAGPMDKSAYEGGQENRLYQHLTSGPQPGVGPSTLVKTRPRSSETHQGFTRPRRLAPSNRNMLTVLFSAPLVWQDSEHQFQPIEMLDFELERELLWQCFKEASRDVELSFDNATTDRLQAAMTKSCACLHFSGHGHPEYLTFEDGKGGLQCLGVGELRNLITNGVEGGEAPFKFVFVSACHSGLAGQTFIDAGVPHVVCCKQETQLMDSAALAFTRAFYLALAIGRTVKDSFEIGRQAVAVSPTVTFPQEEMKKFVLLPEDGNHHVPVFDADLVSEWPKKPANTLLPAGMSRRDVMRRMLSSRDFNAPAEQPPLPTTPQGFLGREIEMYRILNAFLSKPIKRLVTLVGETGVGRGSLASALCHYINDRKSTMFFETIFYIRAQQVRGNDRMGSVIYPLHKRLVAARKATALPKEANIDDVTQSIYKALSHMKALVVVDQLEVIEGSEEAQEFPLFLATLFRETKNVRVLVTAHKKMGMPSLGGVGEYMFPLGPLNLKNTVRLFGMLCPHIHTGDERRHLIEDLVEEQEQFLLARDGAISDRSKSILNILGEGIPSRIYDVAYSMTKDEFAQLKELGFDEHDDEESGFDEHDGEL